jgi:hypothetical protein
VFSLQLLHHPLGRGSAESDVVAFVSGATVADSTELNRRKLTETSRLFRNDSDPQNEEASLMETKRLRTIQQPSHLERLLEAYITRSGAVPQNSYQIRDPEALPTQLRRIARQAVEEQGRVWECWSYGVHQWLFTAEMSLPLSRERGTPVLSVNCYSEDGELTDTGAWLLSPDGFWRRCAE